MTAQSIIDRICKLEEAVEELKSDASADWKTNYLNSLEIIKVMSAEKNRVETTLIAIAAPCVVPKGSDAEMHRGWSKIAKSRIDIARAALQETERV